MDIEVPKGMQLHEKSVYWIQYRAFKDGKDPGTSLGDTQALITKCKFAFTISTFQKRLLEFTLVDTSFHG